eukprot:gene9347-9428_t
MIVSLGHVNDHGPAQIAECEGLPGSVGADRKQSTGWQRTKPHQGARNFLTCAVQQSQGFSLSQDDDMSAERLDALTVDAAINGSGPGHRLETFDILRGVCAVAVVLAHIGGATKHEWFFRLATTSVDFFFLLSGFVIGAAYERTLRHSPHRVLDMLRLRVLRLWPMIILGCLIGVAVAAASPLLIRPGMNADFAVARQFLMVPVLDGRTELYPFNGVMWSLLFELLANLLHAAFLPFLRLRVLVVILLAGIVLLAANMLHVGLETLQGGWSMDSLWQGVLRTMVSYTFGVVLFRLSLRWPAPRLPVRDGMAATVLVLVVLAILAMPVGQAAFGAAGVVVVFPAVVYLASALRLGPTGRIVAVFAGGISYPLYATHLPIVRLIDFELTGWVQGFAFRAAGWLLAVPLLILFAWAVERWIDAPVRRVLRRI